MQIPWHESRYWLAAGWTMFHFAWLGTLFWIFAAMLRSLLPRVNPRQRYAVALALFFLGAVIPIGLFTVALNGAGDRLFGFQSLSPVEDLPGTTASRTASMENGVATVGPIDPLILAEESVERSSQQPFMAWMSLSAHVLNDMRDWSCQWLPWLWLAGMPLTFTVLACGVTGAERLRRAGRPLEEGELGAVCRRMRAALGVSRNVAVAVCDRVATPVLVGIVRPMILLPSAVIAGCSPEQIEMVLLHELAHVKRWDNLVNLVQRLIEAVLFFHPVVWWLSNWVRLEREECCDCVVLKHTGQPQAYAETLAALALPGISPRHAVVAMADRHLVGRIRHILKLEEETMGVSRRGFVALAGLLAFLGCVAAMLVQPARDARAESAIETDGVANDDSTNFAEQVAADIDAQLASDAVDPQQSEDPAQDRVRNHQEFDEKVEKYNLLLREKRFDEAIVIGKQAQLLQPDNPMSQLMVLKAKYAKQGDFEDRPKYQSVDSPASRELTIHRALQRRLWMDFNDEPLSEVIKQVSFRCEISVVLDPSGLVDAGATSNTKITASSQGAKAAKFLDQMLTPLRLDYMIKDDVLLVTSRRRAVGEMITKCYSVAELLPTKVENGRNVVDPTSLEDLAKTISSSVCPETWGDTRDRGQMLPYRTTFSLVIRQTADVHEGVAEFLKKLRRKRDAAVAKHVRIEAPPEQETADADRVAQFEERVRKLEAELMGLREALQGFKPAGNRKE